MQVKQYIKSVAGAVLAPVIKSLSNAFPAWGAGWSMLSGNRFSWLINGSEAYNNKIFYAGANILVRKLTEVPITFSKSKGATAISSRKIDRLYSQSISNEKRVMLKATQLEELKDDHWLNKLFDNPNNFQSRIELMKDFWYNHILGDGYLYFPGLGELSRNAKPDKCYSLARNRVEPVQSNDRFNPIAYYNYTALNGEIIRIEANEILHLKQWNPNYGQLKGLGVDVIAAMDISLNNANNTAQGAGYVNGGRGVAFSSKIDVNSTTGKAIGKMTAEQIQKIEKTVQQDMSGAHNNQRRVFTNGELVVTPYGDTIAEMELIQAEENNWKAIFAVLGIPWSLAPITTAATDNNIAAGYKALVTNLIISLLREFDSKMTKIAQTWEGGIVAMHDLTEFTELAPDLKLMAEVFSRDKGPLLSEDERRKIYNYDEIGGEIGTAYLVPSGLVRVQDILADPFDEAGNENPVNL
jgi:phage portal protein BeeE